MVWYLHVDMDAFFASVEQALDPRLKGKPVIVGGIKGIVNLTGTEKLFGPPVQTSERILARIERDLGLSASGGLSASRVVAKVAATLAKPHGFIHVPDRTEETFLSPLPVEALPGVGPKTHKALLNRGIKTIGDLLEHADLRGRYLDINQQEREGRRYGRSIGHETTFDAALHEPEKMKAVLWKLAEEVGTRLREERLSARCLTLKIRYSSFKTITRSRTLATPTCFDREIFEIGRELLTSHLAVGASVRLLGISASGLLGSGWQEPMFGIDKRLAWQRLYDGMDRLRLKYGHDAVAAAASLDRGHGAQGRRRNVLNLRVSVLS